MKVVFHRAIGLIPVMGVVLLLASACSLGSLANGLLIDQTDTPPAPTAKVEHFPTPTATPTAVSCKETTGHVERVAIPSKLLPPTLWVSVYTPPCFSVTPEEPYPVLYLLHGQNMDDSYWLGLGVGEIADAAITAGQRSFLIVMPYEERQYDPVGDSKFLEGVMQELLPWVEANYPVCLERECRAIGGISRGAGWAVHIDLRSFDTFGAVGAHSLALMPNDRWYVSHLLETHTAGEFPRIYMDRGDKDYLANDPDLFDQTLTINGIAHEYHIAPGSHERAYWQAHVAEYMQWYMQGWP